MKFATRHFYSFPSHFDYVATLPWVVKSPNLLNITKDTTQKSNCMWQKIKNETLHFIWLKGC